MSFGAIKQPRAFGEIVLSWRSPFDIRLGHPDEPIDPFDLAGEPPDRPVSGPIVVKGSWREMSAHERDDLLGQVGLVGHSGKEGTGRFLAFGFMLRRSDPSILGFAGSGRLPEVMAKNGKADDQVFPIFTRSVLGERIHAMQGVSPYVAFGVPFGFLFATDQGLEFGEIPKPVR